jgi:aldose sugar dehydrogenase
LQAGGHRFDPGHVHQFFIESLEHFRENRTQESTQKQAVNTRPDLTKPVIYWVPVIAPGNIMFYQGSVFPQSDGNALISGLGTKAIVRATFDGKGGATAAQRWNIGERVRDIEEAPDGSLWILEDGISGGLFHLTPK